MPFLVVLLLFLPACGLPLRGLSFSGGTETSSAISDAALQHQASFDTLVHNAQQQRIENEMFRQQSRHIFIPR